MMTRVRDRALREVAPFRRGATAAAVAATLWAVWASGPGWVTPALVVAATFGGMLGVIDARTHRLPDALTFPAIAATTALLAVAALGTGDGYAMLRSLAGGGALCLFYLVLHRIDRNGMGQGDVKLAVLLGAVSAWFGWSALLGALVLPFFVGGFVSMVLILARRATRKSAIPFGPFMLLGTALAITWARLAG